MKGWRFAIIAAVLALIVCGWAAKFAVFTLPSPQPIKVTRTSEDELRRAVLLWRDKHGAEGCPTPQRLKDDGVVDPESKLTDAWGTPFQIACTRDEITVTSFGPDKVESADDIVSSPRRPH
jgi:hypothetical protein